MDGETPQIATGITTKYQEGHLARDVDKVEIKKAYNFGGTKVMFSPEEQKQLRDFGSPILRIIGFKPRSMLKIQDSVKKSTFIYPSEEDFIGSTRVFSAFWKKLLKDKIMGVAWYIARANASPLLVAILPSKERFDDNHMQVVPAGLWLYPIPFADDIRDLPPVPRPLRASNDLTEIMRKVVQQVRKDPEVCFVPFAYSNSFPHSLPSEVLQVKIVRLKQADFIFLVYHLAWLFCLTVNPVATSGWFVRPRQIPKPISSMALQNHSSHGT
jgi:ATP-dependent DNA helicase 2 subunit 1